MVIKELKAQIAALTEAMKEKDVPAKVMTTLKESSSKLQKLLEKAREAAKEGYEEEGEEEGGMPGEEGGHVEPHKIAPGHKMTKTVTVKHDGPADEEDGDMDGDEKDEKDEKDAEESRKVHIECMLKEAGIPKDLWSIERLLKMSLQEAKDTIAEKKAYVEHARKAVEGTLEEVPAGQGATAQESDKGNLNSLFESCAR